MGKSFHHFFEVGEKLEGAVISSNHPMISETSSENRLNTIIYSSSGPEILGTLVNGQWSCKNGMSPNEESILDNYRSTLKDLNIR